MSIIKELLAASRSDAFLLNEEMSERQLKKLDLRLVQGFKRSGSTIEVKFADIAKLCELAAREEQLERERAWEADGIERLRAALSASFCA